MLDPEKVQHRGAVRLFTIGVVSMNQRTVTITLALICLMTVVGWVGLRGGAGLQETSEEVVRSP